LYVQRPGKPSWGQPGPQIDFKWPHSLGFMILPKKRMVLDSRSRIMSRKGRSTLRVGGTEVRLTPTEVAPAASRPPSSIFKKVLCLILA